VLPQRCSYLDYIPALSARVLSEVSTNRCITYILRVINDSKTAVEAQYPVGGDWPSGSIRKLNHLGEAAPKINRVTGFAVLRRL